MNPYAWLAAALALLGVLTFLAGLGVWLVLSIVLSIAEIGVSQPWPST